MEEEATHRAIMIANLTGAPLYVVHVSAKQAVEQLAAARDKGQNVFGELFHTSTFHLKINSAHLVSRAPSGSVPHHCGLAPMDIKTPCGKHCGPMICRSFPLITARSA